MTYIEAAERVQTITSVLDRFAVQQSVATTGVGSATAASADFADVLSRSASTGSVSGADIVADARTYLGVPYVFGGTDSSGLDCSGLVQRVYADAGIQLPRRVTQQMTMGTEVGSLAEAQPGDLIVTGGGDHILIYAGDGKVIHAPYEGRTVSEVKAYMSDDEITTIRRIIPSASATTAAASPSPATALDVIAAARFAFLKAAA